MNLLLVTYTLTAFDYIYIIVAALFLVALVWSLIAKLSVVSKYVKYNRVQPKNGLTGESAARLLLDALDMKDVQVQKQSAFSSYYLGNRYSPRKKAIFLRKNIANKSSLTAVALACQKVGLAYQDKIGNKKYKTRSKLQPYFYFAPFAVVPIIAVGILLDLLLSTTGIITVISVILAFAFFLAAFIVQLLMIPTEKQANKQALELIKRANFLDDEELNKVEKIFNAYIIGYIADFVVTVLYIILYILKLLSKLKTNK